MSVKSKREENLDYIKQNIGYDLAKSLLWTIKTDTGDPLGAIRTHLANITSFNEEKKKKKKILIKKLNSYNIKIHDEINKNFAKKSLTDLYSFVDKRNEDYDLSEDFTELANLIKSVFDVQNVYFGKIYETEYKKKKKKKILKFICATENCHLKNEIIYDKQQISNMFTQIHSPKKRANFISSKIFPFENNFLFPHLISNHYNYEQSGENLFTWLNPYNQEDSYLQRIKNTIFSSVQSKRGKGSNGKSANGEEHKKGEAVETDEGSGTDETDMRKHNDEPNDKKDDHSDVDLTESGSNNEGEEEGRHCENSEDSKVESESAVGNKESESGVRQVESESAGCKEETESAVGNEKEFQNELLDTLNMNLSYNCIYIYEIMEEDNSFLYSTMKPGDFLLIPIVYHTYYNLHFLNQMYCFNRNTHLKSIQETDATHEVISPWEYNKKDGMQPSGEMNIKGGKKKKKTYEPSGEKKSEKMNLDRKKIEKVEMCMCLDNRGSVNKIDSRQINNLINFSYFLITRIVKGERKSMEQQVNYMINCQHGEEKRCIDELHSKMETPNFEHVINKFQKTLTDHHFYKKSENLMKYMCLLQWMKKKIYKHQKKVLQIKKIKIEFNQNCLITLFSCFILLGYDYSLFTSLNDTFEKCECEWRELILCVDEYFIDNLMSSNPLLSFEEKGIDKLQEIICLLDKVSSLTSKKYPLHMENITTFGLTLLDHFNQVTRNILNEVLKIKEGEPATASK
ncbi:hypothetical protein, conserved [Plasmodium gonderi]|uniref:Uncharacterized protein n=1 Tax=Plasmodium gonderi TaxID=77519 RepID=A0A1Y1JJ83_PLAGO|nr:hypothetical protein, conserved [Plasmodium gonderi]GAW81455.1 hypothetical protein, conserved [Plasmodium gonderi]